MARCRTTRLFSKNRHGRFRDCDVLRMRLGGRRGGTTREVHIPVNCRPTGGREHAAAAVGPQLHFFLCGPKGIGFGLRHRSRQSGLGSPHRLRLAARAPATFSAQPSGTRVAGQRTDYYQATILPTQRHRRRAGLRMRPSPQAFTSTSSARAKRKGRRDRAPARTRNSRVRRKVNAPDAFSWSSHRRENVAIGGTGGSAPRRIPASGGCPPKPLAGRKPAYRLAAPVGLGPFWSSLDRGMALHFRRIAPATRELEIWSASERGFSFVISNESSSGPGLRGRPGFVASWRPINLNRTAVRVGGSPFRTLRRPVRPCW
jgi:hypothetical protein